MNWMQRFGPKSLPSKPGGRGGEGPGMPPPPRQDWKNNESLYGGGPGSGGSRRMGTPTIGNILSGRPNSKRY